MDLEIKDVAELLNVSEKTIRSWVQEGKIPCYSINQRYLFSRSEIENWVLSKRFDVESKAVNGNNEEKSSKGSLGGTKQYSLFRAVHKGGILFDVPGKTKEDVIRNAVKTIAKDLHIDADVMTELLLDREKLMPTALSHGIAVPHARDFLLSPHHQDVIWTVFPQQPLDYGALDEQPVHTLFFLFACEDKRHLHLLAKVAHLSSQTSSREYLKTKPSKEQLLSYIKEWEAGIPNRG